jgi:hypothetical protein
MALIGGFLPPVSAFAVITRDSQANFVHATEDVLGLYMAVFGALDNVGQVMRTRQRIQYGE